MRQSSQVVLAIMLAGLVTVATTSALAQLGISANGGNQAETRTVKIINSTNDVNSVRVHCLHFDGRSFFRDVVKGNEPIVDGVLIGERTVVAYGPTEKILAFKKLPLRAGDEPTVIGVFGNAADGYRIDLGNL